MKLANIATVLVHGRNELHLKFNNDADLREAYTEITQRMEQAATQAEACGCTDSIQCAQCERNERAAPTAPTGAQPKNFLERWTEVIEQAAPKAES